MDLNLLGQCWQRCGLSPVCLRWCTSRSCRLTKAAPQSGHTCFLAALTPRWRLSRCAVSRPLVENALPQSEQGNGLSPVWIR